MPIDPITSIAQAGLAPNPQIQDPARIPSIEGLGEEARVEFSPASGAEPVSFEAQLGALLQNLNATQTEADVQAQALASGQTTDIAQVVVAVERAQLQLQLATTIRNKLVEAFNELQRTQV